MMAQKAAKTATNTPRPAQPRLTRSSSMREQAARDKLEQKSPIPHPSRPRSHTTSGGIQPETAAKEANHKKRRYCWIKAPSLAGPDRREQRLLKLALLPNTPLLPRQRLK
ncbi:hypothetical protein QAD02_007269 [Eretmocerus hayati]|uniref:Uncharacterized protein n=1 Tax=Eretmocerus hayati TaxID=131215 RepID=A0ACC2N5M5_9HYME|nr:hypothetical protein QAD02_007269 [Eretmocerus hayati]